MADASGDQVRLRGEIPDSGKFEGEGYFRVYEEEHRMEWGAEVYQDYSGRPRVSGLGEGKSEVTAELYFGERSVEGK